MKIGDRVFVRGYIDEIRKDTVIVRNDGGYFGTIPSEVITGELPSAQQWISCEERLPEEEKAYLVTFACEKVGMSSWHKDTFNRGFNRGFDAYMTGVTEDGGCEYFGVVAWMEKPGTVERRRA